MAEGPKSGFLGAGERAKRREASRAKRALIHAKRVSQRAKRAAHCERSERMNFGEAEEE